MKHTTEPEINARNDTDAIILRLSGLRALKFPIMTPNELGFAKPQIANVAMAELRSFSKRKTHNN